MMTRLCKPLFPGFYLLLLLIVFLSSCGSSEKNQLAADESMQAITAEAPATVGDTERKLVKTGSVTFETSSLSETKKQIDAAVKKHNAYIASEQAYTSPSSQNYTLIVRMPANHFDALLADATAGVGKFDSKDIGIQDVTEEFVDVQARIRTKKELESRYLELLKKANQISEILEIEKQIGELRADIEAAEGRMRYLSNQSEYATLTISYYVSMKPQVEFATKFKQGIATGWDNFMWMLVGLVHIWPLILLAILLVWLFRYWRKKKRTIDR
ncbi:DUF4349 domain-containing protein [Parapedobacter pyrenivorans]|uniref:DUF4349 domain-containing protein n=1 Tax=Parapedobacter pyrenivorans TaxID=1305674 RepID=UPI003342C41A